MSDELKSIKIYPVFNQAFYSREHAEGEYELLGDALGRDFIIEKLVDGFLKSYKGSGTENADWFTYGADVFAPCNAIVQNVHINPNENVPRKVNQNPSSSVLFRTKDNVYILYGHLIDIKVDVNDRVKVGQVIGKCGNNGMSRFPHVHVGAWKDNKPLQISVDLQALGDIRKEDIESYYFLK
ncbi:M23 family metallopeptidase [Sutcliffiella horikoshii]|uniref:M23 family metallopeptidase n=1 Tax=Sutcliffiella horikoshii TaxID=79883 RepID=UPI003CF26EFA